MMGRIAASAHSPSRAPGLGLYYDSLSISLAGRMPHLPQPIIHLCGPADAPPLHLMPANGFPPQCYLPLLRRLPGYRAFCLPPRALWGDQAAPDDYRGWDEAADDLLAGLEAHTGHGGVAVGHSLGGIVSMLALMKQPGRFRALIMLDPVLLPRTTLRAFARAWQDGSIEQFPLVQGARRRRRKFDSQAEAFCRFRKKPIFADWTDEALWLYVRQGTKASADGCGIELVWSADWEAHYFATVYRRVWQDLPGLNGLAPMLLVRARGSDTFPDSVLGQARSMLPAADFITLDDQGHLFPLAAPELTARVIARWLEKCREW
ncbi:MAG: alpha/beta hydrolase [Chloroflexi bacterium]|nr:alpha/beta hydrolase [Chloroflexota bacterium]MCY4246456.1 alpha/beta hydrolase [Chloroflexota bacterium]